MFIHFYVFIYSFSFAIIWIIFFKVYFLLIITLHIFISTDNVVWHLSRCLLEMHLLFRGFKNIFIGITLIYKVVLVNFQVYSKANQLCINIYPFLFRFFSHVGYYIVLSRFHYAIQQVIVTYPFFYIVVCVRPSYPPNAPPPHISPLVTINLVLKSLSVS